MALTFRKLKQITIIWRRKKHVTSRGFLARLLLNRPTHRAIWTAYNLSWSCPCAPHQTVLLWRVGGRVQNARFLPANRFASAGLCDSNVSVCLSVCLSVTSRYCVKTKKASVVTFLPSRSPTILVFWCQISSKHSKGIPERGRQTREGMGKISSFLSLSVNISKTLADND